MRTTALGIVFVVLCGIGAAPLLVRTDPIPAFQPHAAFSGTAIASAPVGVLLGPGSAPSTESALH